MAAAVAAPRAANGFTTYQDLNWTPETKVGAEWEQETAFIPSVGRSPEQSPARNPRFMARKTKKKIKDESLLGSLFGLICEHQIGLSVNLLLLLLLSHLAFPRVRWRTQKFFHLSYYNEANGLYHTGIDDLSFVAFWVVVFTGLRAGVMDYILHPLASLGGIKKARTKVRFVEQAWLLVYYSFYVPLGMYIMYHSDYWFNLKGMWTNWPIREVNGLFKWYYLTQFAFWLQQILVVNIEERRKDYAQYLVHHIITCALMFMSYGFYHMRVGNVILCCMDVVDIILSTAKMLKYLGFGSICDYAFGLFMAVWVIARHVFYNMTCWSLHVDTPTELPSACYYSDTGAMIAPGDPGYEPDGGSLVWKNILQTYLNPKGPVCWNTPVRWSFLGLLIALQVITLIWFAMIVRVAWKVVNGQPADDERSGDEGEKEEEDLEVEEHTNPKAKPLLPAKAKAKANTEGVPVEEEVGVESLTFVRRTNPGVLTYKRSSTGRGGTSRASGISIPGHGDRKELLGRIGCDKPT